MFIASPTTGQPNIGLSSQSDLSLSPLSARRMQTLKAIPKYNSHCHLGGEIPIDVLVKYATHDQIKTLEKGFADIVQGKEYEQAFFIFPLISQLINTHEKLKEATYQTCQRLKADNNQFVLMRTGLKSIETGSYEDYLKAVLEGIKEASCENFSVLLMLSLKRSSSLEMAKITVDLALKHCKNGVVGIDISDTSTIGDINIIMSELLRSKKEGLKIAVHMGESIKEKDQMLIINQLQPDFIDHGVNLCQEAQEWIEKNHIPVTICLTSSLATKMHGPEVSHPWIIKHLESGHPIHLGTDDATVFGNISLSSEFFHLSPSLDFERVVKLVNDSFERAKELFKSL